MKWIIDLDVDKCSACGACAIACMDQNDIDPGKQRPFRQVFALEEKLQEKLKCTFLSSGCMHCADAPCVKGCPSGCLYKDEETGFTLYDNTNCIGCHSCSMACPFGAPSFNPQGKMEKCDGCYLRLADGRLPACVQACPTGALKVYREDEYRARSSGRMLRMVLQCDEAR